MDLQRNLFPVAIDLQGKKSVEVHVTKLLQLLHRDRNPPAFCVCVFDLWFDEERVYVLLMEQFK